MSQKNGVVRWFNNAKGYGFLGQDDGPDIFIHYSAIQGEGFKTLKEGDKVTFDVVLGNKGPQADAVEIVERANEDTPSMPFRGSPPDTSNPKPETDN